MRIYAGLGERILSFLVDWIILSLIGGLIFFINPLFLLFSGWIPVLYFVLFEGSSWHASIGKKITGQKIISENGRGITYGQSFLRYIYTILTAATLGIGFLTVKTSDKFQALHDRLAQTCVVKSNNNTYVDNLTGRKNHTPVNCYVIGTSGFFAGKTFPISAGGIMIGRDTTSCKIAFPSDQRGVSWQHCTIIYNYQTNMFLVNDINSSYGTYLGNGYRIASNKMAALKSGDRFYIGAKNNMFEVREKYSELN